MSGQIVVTLEYHHPDNPVPTRYSVWAVPDAAGSMLRVMDALADVDDPDEIARIAAAINEAVTG